MSVKKKPRPPSDAQIAEIVQAEMAGKKRPWFCPVCGSSVGDLCEETYEYGVDYVRRKVGMDCQNCGHMVQCYACRGWLTEAWLSGTAPEDYRMYLCDCPTAGAEFGFGELTTPPGTGSPRR